MKFGFNATRTRKFLTNLLLEESPFEKFEENELLNENAPIQKGGMSAQIQYIFEALGSIRLTSHRDRNRVALAQENMKKVRRHVKMLENNVELLQEKLILLEESKSEPEETSKEK
jgi:hypothetical protein